MIKRKDVLVILIALLLALVLFVLTRSGIRLNSIGGDDPLSILSEVKQQSDSGMPMETARDQAISYLVVTVGDNKYKPLPILKESVYRLHQSNGRDNVFHVTDDSVWMETANCDNQNCIHQGVVSLDNRNTRVLGNLIVCLPNQVVLELLTPQEAGAEEQ